jgi:hypothetical protein
MVLGVVTGCHTGRPCCRTWRLWPWRRAGRRPGRDRYLPGSSLAEVLREAQSDDAAQTLGTPPWHDDDVRLVLPRGLGEDLAFRSACGEVVDGRRVTDGLCRLREPLVCEQPQLLVPRPGARPAVGAADVRSLLRCHGRDGERGSGRPCDVERVGKRRVTFAGRVIRDQHTPHPFRRWLHCDLSAEL